MSLQRSLLATATLFVGLVLLGVYFFFDSGNQLMLWFSILVSSASLSSILAQTGSYKMKLAALLLFASAYHVAPLLRGGGVGLPSRLLYSRDEAYQAQLDSLVLESGTWRPGIGLGPAFAYSFYPSLTMVSVVVANVFGANTGVSFFVNVTFPIVTAVLPLMFYVASMGKILRDANWALWSAYIFILNEQFLFFDSSFAYESLGIIFFTLTIYLLTTRFNRAGKLLTILNILAMTFSHFWTNFNLIFFLAVFYLTPYALRLLYDRRASVMKTSSLLTLNSTTLLIAVFSFAAYSSFVATIVPLRYGIPLLLVLSQIIAPVSRIAPNPQYRSTFEIFLIILGQLVLIVFGTHGFLSRKVGPLAPFLKTIFVIGGIYLMVILFALPGSLAQPVIHRGFFFAFFVLAPVIAWTIARSGKAWRRKMKALLLVLVVVSIVLIQEPWFIYPDFVAPPSQFYAGVWASSHIPFGSPIIGTGSISDTFGTYGRLRDLGVGSYYGNEHLIVGSFLQRNVSNLLKPYDARYLAFSSNNNSRVLRYFVEQQESTVPGQEFLSNTTQYLDQTPRFDRVLNSGYVSVYYVGYY
ncbi:MAG: hypothetical protein ABSC50_07280 [Candidatus Bathyarchaeia archaeon]